MRMYVALSFANISKSSSVNSVQYLKDEKNRKKQTANCKEKEGSSPWNGKCYNKTAKNNEEHRDMHKEADGMAVKAEQEQEFALLAPQWWNELPTNVKK